MRWTSLLASVLVAGSCGGRPLDEELMPQPDAAKYTFVVSRLRAPPSQTSFALDLDGDKRADNQLGNLVSALRQLGDDVQASFDKRVGTDVFLLLTVQSADPTLRRDDAVGVTFAVGRKQGNEVVADDSVAASTVYGKLVDGVFTSNAPAVTRRPVTATVDLPMYADEPALRYRLAGTHVKLTFATDARSCSGELHGSITQAQLWPATYEVIAHHIQSIVDADPASASAMYSLGLFDVGSACTNPDGSQSAPRDGKITPCEVRNTQIVKDLFAPDVRIFNALGVYAPDAENPAKDSLSVGLALDASRG